MRPINYLSHKASVLKESRETLAQIDRELARAGLRRMGAGRAIPDPTIKEELYLTFAVVCQGRRSVMRAAETAQAWAELTCDNGRGEAYQALKGKTLIECLEEVCMAIAAGKIEEEVKATFDLTDEHATIAFPEREGGQFLMFGSMGSRASYFRRSEETLDGRYLADIARSAGASI